MFLYNRRVIIFFIERRVFLEKKNLERDFDGASIPIQSSERALSIKITLESHIQGVSLLSGHISVMDLSATFR